VAALIPEKYRSLIQARLREHACQACGHSLEQSAVVRAGEGTTLEEYGLSETAAAHLLAATEVLTVVCGQCGSSCELGTPLQLAPEPRRLTANDMADWSRAAKGTYESIIAVRLSDRTCEGCGHSLREARVERAAGGAVLPEFDFDDEAALALIAWTQCLKVRCPHCSRRLAIE
jgi:hypothetical protein